MKEDYPLIEFNDHKLNELKENAARKASAAEILTQTETLRQLAVKGKLKGIMIWIDDFLGGSNDKLVVFARHQFVIEELMRKYGKIALKIDGTVSNINRQLAVDKFQNTSSFRLFIISEAGGIGITLTAASHIAITELPWTPSKLDQAVDRLHRITQKNSVNVYFLLAMNTIEEAIAHLLDEKRKVIDAVIDGKETKNMNLLIELLKQYKLKN
jgi:SNF2 family DNA or RNA helicase